MLHEDFGAPLVATCSNSRASPPGVPWHLPEGSGGGPRGGSPDRTWRPWSPRVQPAALGERSAARPPSLACPAGGLSGGCGAHCRTPTGLPCWPGPAKLRLSFRPSHPTLQLENASSEQPHNSYHTLCGPPCGSRHSPRIYCLIRADVSS